MTDHEAEREIAWRGRGVGLAPLETEDAELVHAWRCDPVASAEVGYWPRALSATRERIERDIDDSDRDDFLVLALPDRTPIGHLAAYDLDLLDGTVELALVLDPAWRGKGLGTAAVDAVVDLLFGETSAIHRIEANVHAANAASLRTLEKAGFTREGVRRSACVHRGRRHDVAVLALLREEWAALDRLRAWENQARD